MTHADFSMRRLESGVVVAVDSHFDEESGEWQLSWVDGHSRATLVLTLDDLAEVGDLLTGYVARMRQTGGEPDDPGPRLPGF